MKRTLLAAVLFLGCGGQDMAASDPPLSNGEVCDFFSAHFCPRLIACSPGGMLYDCVAGFKKTCCLDNGDCARESGGGRSVFDEYKRSCGPALDAQACPAILAQPWVAPAACK